MKTPVLILFLSLLALTSRAQQDSSVVEIVDVPDVDATFPGGMEAMMHFIADNYVYPECDIELGQGRVLVMFVVHADGHLSDITILKRVHPKIDQAAIDVIQKMPSWIPAELNREPVATRVRIPINTLIK